MEEETKECVRAVEKSKQQTQTDVRTVWWEEDGF